MEEVVTNDTINTPHHNLSAVPNLNNGSASGGNRNLPSSAPSEHNASASVYYFPS